ncbi:MAG: response regulator [Acidobacteriota bacterium]|nr:response regulator [Acidobacteriota bacterium]
MNKVLLADDSATIQKLVEMALSDSDFELLAVSDGKQAVDKLAEFQPDIILADAIMPALNGYEVCEHVKSSAFQHIPVILLTGRFQPYDKELADKVGVDEKIVKPFSQEQLVSVMRRLIDQARSTAPAPQPEPEPDDAAGFFDEGATIQASPEELRASLQGAQADQVAARAEVPDIGDFALDEADTDEPMELHTEDLEELEDEELIETTDVDHATLQDDELEGLDDDDLDLSDAEMASPDQMAETLDLQDVHQIEANITPDLAIDEDTADLEADELQLGEAEELGEDDELLTSGLELDDSLDLSDDSLDMSDDSLEMSDDSLDLSDDSLEELGDEDFATLDDEDTRPVTPDPEEDTQPVLGDDTQPSLEVPGPIDHHDELVLDDHADTTSLDEEPELDLATLPGNESIPELGVDEPMELPSLETEEPEPIHSEADTVQLNQEQIEGFREVSESETLSEDDFDLDLGEEDTAATDFNVEEVDEPLLPEVSETIEPEAISPEPEPEPIALEPALEPIAAEPETGFAMPDVDEPILEEIGEDEPEPLVLESDDMDVLEVEEDEPAASGATPVAPPLHEAVATAAGGPLSLSDEQMDQLAEKVAANLVKSVGSDYVREVIWQVVPELAEAMIKKRIYQLERSVEDN